MANRIINIVAILSIIAILAWKDEFPLATYLCHQAQWQKCPDAKLRHIQHANQYCLTTECLAKHNLGKMQNEAALITYECLSLIP